MNQSTLQLALCPLLELNAVCHMLSIACESRHITVINADYVTTLVQINMGGKAKTVDILHRNQSLYRLPFMDRVCGLKREIRLVE